MDGDGMQDSCYGGASLAGAVIGTFLTTILLLVVAALVYRQWRRHKGKHLVLVTNPEIVEDAYAFDNPCFKDATPAVSRNHDSRPLSTASLVIETSPTTKDSARWSSPWSSLGLASVNKNDRRRTLDDSCLGSKATRVSVVSLRSRDFTGLGFNVCGNMREGIFVKDLLHRGPASESGRIHPGDRIGSVKISFRSMVYEDALTILSYASPYDVELEVENGGSGAGSRPATLLKKTVGPSPSRICHPLYRSQSIPELSQAHKTSSAKRLFIADPNESLGSNYSTMNSTIKSSKSTPGSHTLERRHEDAKTQNHHHHHYQQQQQPQQQQHQQQQQQQQQHNHHKFGIKVLPALDGTVHRIENQNEHNTNLERRNSRKLDIDNEKSDDVALSTSKEINDNEFRNWLSERYQKRENSRDPTIVKCSPNNVTTFDKESNARSVASNGHDVTDVSTSVENKPSESMEAVMMVSEVPAEVQNAGMAAKRNRKSSMEPLNTARPTSVVVDSGTSTDLKSPQKNKRKAPAPPVNPVAAAAADGNEIEADSSGHSNESVTSSRKNERDDAEDGIESITDYAESLSDYVGKIRNESTIEKTSEAVRNPSEQQDATSRRQKKSETTDSDSDDSEIHDSFTTIELKPADITIHHTPVPVIDGLEPNSEKNGDDNDGEEDDNDNDVYRKAASLGDLSRYENKSLATLERAQSLDMADTGSKKRKLATPDDINETTEVDLTKHESVDSFDRRKLKKSDEWGTLEDAIWRKTEDADNEATKQQQTRGRGGNNGNLERSRSAIEMKLRDEEVVKSADPSGRLIPIEMTDDTSIELYNLPLSMTLTGEFIRTERMFNPDEDNSLARIVNNGRIVKSPTPEEMELDFRRAVPEPSVEQEFKVTKVEASEVGKSPRDEEFAAALRYFDREIVRSSLTSERGNTTNLDDTRNEEIDRKIDNGDSIYAGRKEIQEELMRKVTVVTGCPGCDRKHSGRNEQHSCARLSGSNNLETNSRDQLDWQPQQVSKLPESPKDDDNKSSSLSAFKIGLTRFERTYGDARSKSASPTESRIEKRLLRERGIEIDDEEDDNDDDEGTRRRNELEETKRHLEAVNDEEDDAEEGYDFGTGITVNRKSVPSPVVDHHNVSNVSVSSGEASEDSGLVGESGDYARQDSEPRPPLPDTPMPSSGSHQNKLTYITEINVSPTGGTVLDNQQDRADISMTRATGKPENVNKPPRNEVTLASNGKSTTVKKPPVPPRRNDASKIQSRDNETSSDKRFVYVSEYRSPSGKDKNENNDKSPAVQDVNKLGGNKKFENWIYLGENKEQNPWGNGSSQQQPVTSIVVSAGDDKKNANHQ